MAENVERFAVDYRGDFYPEPNGQWVKFTAHYRELTAERTAREAVEEALARVEEENDERRRLLFEQAQNVEQQVRYGVQQMMRAEAAWADVARLRGEIERLAADWETADRDVTTGVTMFQRLNICADELRGVLGGVGSGT